jgi:DNA-binding NarL/FixJ family response regulator
MTDINIVIIDDHNILRESLSQMIDRESDIKVIGQAINGKDGLELVRSLNPDVILMDISMPDMDGITATTILLTENPNYKILAFTMHEEPYMIFKMLKAGARGYILKDAKYSELLEAIHTIYRGEVYLTPRVSSLVVKSYYDKLTELATDPLSILSKREREIFHYLIKGDNNKIISDKLALSVNTVLTHRRNLMEKLNCHSLSDLTRLAHENNLI